MPVDAPAPATGRRAVGGRAVWITVDQAVSSLTNAGVTIFAARAVSATDYGAFALVFSVYTLVQAVSQGLAGQVVIIRYSARDAAERRTAAAHATACAVALGATASAVLLVAALCTAPPISAGLAVGAAIFPMILLQDMWRTVLICDMRPRAAFVNDAVWAAMQFGVIALITLTHTATLATFLLAWGAAGAVAAVLGVRQTGVRPRFAGLPTWLRRHRDLSVSSTVNAVAVLGAAQLTFVLLASFGSVETLGALRGAQTLLGPLNIIGFAIAAFAVPEIVRRRLETRQYVLVALAISGVLVFVDLVWGAILLSMPDAVGVELLGDTWTRAALALPAMIFFTAAIGATTGASSVMRAIERTDLNLKASLVLAPLVMVLPVVGVLVAATAGAALGFLAAALVALPFSWWLLQRGLRQRAGSRGPR